jgi:hypothetical protein
MNELPDPRRFGGGSVTDQLTDLARRVRDADALASAGAMLKLRRAVERCLAQGDDARWRRTLEQADDAGVYRALHEALARSIDAPLEATDPVVARAFAIPIVLVAAASRPVRLPGALADIEAVRRLFEANDALGPTRNFGLSNALCSLQSLEAVSPVAIYRSARDLDAAKLQASVEPAEIAIDPNREQTHLRFIVGAGVTARDAPGFTETAANIGGWGRECAKVLTAQLAVPGLHLLVLPRPPQNLIMAPHAGRNAQLETSFNLFTSNAVRRLRAAVGEPTIILSAHEDAELRVTASSPFAPDLTQGFRWPLHPLDDIGRIERVIRELFAEIRVGDVRVAPRVLESLRASGIELYPRCDEWDALAAGRRAH